MWTSLFRKSWKSTFGLFVLIGSVGTVSILGVVGCTGSARETVRLEGVAEDSPGERIGLKRQGIQLRSSRRRQEIQEQDAALSGGTPGDQDLGHLVRSPLSQQDPRQTDDGSLPIRLERLA